MRICCYRTWAAFTLEYWVDRNAITVRWANLRQMIPLPSRSPALSTDADLPIGKPGLLEWPAPYLRTIVGHGAKHPTVCHAPAQRVPAA